MHRSLVRLSLQSQRYYKPFLPTTTTATATVSRRNMSSALEIELTAPNGVKYTQPTGLFINNEWVKSSKGNKITSINPR
jgi:hypothetical protein